MISPAPEGLASAPLTDGLVDDAARREHPRTARDVATRQGRLRRAANGYWFIHWSEGRRSKRLSTGTRDRSAAKSYLEEWQNSPTPRVDPLPARAAIAVPAAPVPTPSSDKLANRQSTRLTFKLRCAPNGTFYLHWSEGRRTKRVSTRTKDLNEAKAYLRNWLKVELSGAPTCAALWALYLREHVNKKNAAPERHRYAWQAMERRFGSLRPAEVTRETIARHLRARLPTKPSSVFLELRLLTASWNFGVRRRVIDPKDVPALDDLDLPKPPPRRERWLRKEEVKRLFAAAAEMRRGSRFSRIERFMWLALQTGSRREALLTLRWEQVDFETRVIHLNPEGRAQTTKKRASVPITTALLPILERAYRERINDLVLDQPKRMHDQMNSVADRAGVSGVTAHVFRHTAATWMARRGVPLWKIAKFLGNSVDEIERTYAKHSPDDLRDDVEVLSEPFEVSPDEL